MTTYTGTGGDDTINGSNGSDTIDGQGGNDDLNGGNGNDTVSGGEGDDEIDGGNGNDTLSGDAGDDTIDGGNGNDTIDGGDDDDAIFGGNGNDDLFGGDGNDTLLGENGNDDITGGGGDDIIDGNNGFDTAYFSGPIGEYSFFVSDGWLHVVHLGGAGADGHDQLKRVERLVFADRVIDVGSGDNAPVAGDDHVFIDEDTGVYNSGSASVTDNDFDFDGDALTVTPGVFVGTYGTLTLNADGTYSYALFANAQELAQGENVQDSFNYTVSDDDGSDTGTLVFHIAGVNDAPTANPDTDSTSENATVLVDVLANDTDVDNGAVLTVTGASAPVGQGTASVVGNQVEFDPGSDFDYLAVGESVDVVVSYDIEDEHGASDSSTVTITVTGTNDAPTIDAGGTDDSGAVTELPNNDPNENAFTHQDSGAVAFDDLDLSDTHSASVTPQGGGYLGSFTLDPVNQAGDSVGWNFSVEDSDLDFLEDGETLIQTYTIEIDDGNGGTVTQDVTITLTGAADGPQTDWYIDNSALGSANLGTQDDPYTSIAAFNAAQGTLGGPQVGANVFLLAGTGTGVYAEADGINLLDDQVLTGVATGPIRPTITPGAGNGVDLAENNILSGFDVVTTASTGILDASAAAGSVTISDVNVTSASGVAISLSSATGVSIANATIVSTGNYAISGVSIAGFALTDSVVTGGLGSDAAVALTGLTGIASLLGNLLSGGDDTLRITNGSGALDLTIADSVDNQAVFGLNNLNGNDSILITTSGGAALTFTLDGVDFTGARGDLLQTVAGDTSTHELTITGNSFHNSHANIVSGGGGVHIGGSGTDIAVDYVVAGNSFRGADGNALSAIFTPAAGTIRGQIADNVVGINDGIAGSEGSSGGGDGIVVAVEKAAGPGVLTHSLDLSDNQVYDIAFGLAGISLRSSGGGVGNGAVLEATVSGNTVAELGDFTLAAFYALVGGSAGSGDFARLGLDMTDNVFDASDADFGLNAVLLDQISTDAHFHFPGYAGSPDGELNGGTASDDIAAYLASQGNTLVDPPFAAYPGGVYAEFVFGVTGDLFTLPAWP